MAWVLGVAIFWVDGGLGSRGCDFLGLTVAWVLEVAIFWVDGGLGSRGCDFLG